MPSSKAIRFDEEGNAIKVDSGVRDINEIEGLLLMFDDDGVESMGTEALSSRLENVKSQLEQTEEKDRMREKIRIKEKKMIKKQKDKEMNKVQTIPQVFLDNGNSMDEEEEE